MRSLNFVLSILFCLFIPRVLANTPECDGESSTTCKTLNGIHFCFSYSFSTLEQQTSVTLKIKDKSGNLNWLHHWMMKNSDFRELLLQEGIDKKTWGKKFLFGQLVYGAKIKIGPVDAKSMDNDLLNEYAKRNKLNRLSLKNEISNDGKCIQLTYRAVWREDLYELAYVQSIGKFIVYGHGEY